MKPIVFLLGLLPLIAIARSGGAGNGGDAIVCADKVILLDSYEAQKMRLHIDLNPDNIQNPTWRSMVNVAVARLERFDQVLAGTLYDYSMEMVNDFEKFEKFPEARGKAVYLGYDVLTPINDSLHVSMPEGEGCEEKPRQLVSQKVPRFSRELRYEFSKSLWEEMDLQEQTLTILHEAWYRIMLENEAEDSRAARYMNGLVASIDFDYFTFEDYIQEISATELASYTVPNVSEILFDEKIVFNLKEHKIFFTDGNLCAKGFVLSPRIKETFTLLNQTQRYVSNTAIPLICVKNSKLVSLELPKKMISSKYTLRFSFFQLEFSKEYASPLVHFHKNGKVKEITGVEFNWYMPMFYTCNGKRSYDQKFNCEAGPFIDHDKKVKDLSTLKFNEKEMPILN